MSGFSVNVGGVPSPRGTTRSQPITRGVSPIFTAQKIVRACYLAVNVRCRRMSVEIQAAPVRWQQWPCGPDCRQAQPMAGTYGKWHWCNHPEVGGKAVRDGLECIYFEAASSLSTGSTPVRRRE